MADWQSDATRLTLCRAVKSQALASLVDEPQCVMNSGIGRVQLQQPSPVERRKPLSMKLN